MDTISAVLQLCTRVVEALKALLDLVRSRDAEGVRYDARKHRPKHLKAKQRARGVLQTPEALAIQQALPSDP